MKANDLRIGNWYNMSTKGDDNIHQITGKDIWEFESDPIDDIYYPIPITEEWLLKFGFKKCSNDTDFETKYLYQINDNFILLNEPRGYFYIDACNNEVKHVHQLQNLYFALVGEELIKQ